MSHPLRLVGQMAGVHEPSAFPRLPVTKPWESVKIMNSWTPHQLTRTHGLVLVWKWAPPNL